MNILAVIPARFASTRFPGKPLALIGEKPMIQYVYELCVNSNLFKDVIVATDDQKIYKEVVKFKGKAVMTADTHESGTDRCFEALENSNGEYDAIVNVQGDEPFIKKESLEKLVNLLKTGTQIATLAVKATSVNQLDDPNKVKVVISGTERALYFSRSCIPFVRDQEKKNWLDTTDFFIHLGLYGFNTTAIPEIKKLAISPLEQIEKLEQLRWLENGFSISCGLTNEAPFGVDTPNDLEEANKRMLG